MTQTAVENTGKNTIETFEETTPPTGSGCGCGGGSCCGESGVKTDTDAPSLPGSVTIDGRKIAVVPGDKNIVDVASRANIKIPAPCYRAQQKKGCCGACVIEIDGEQKYACAMPPENAMNIVVNRSDLKAIRKQRLQEYKEGVKSGKPLECPLSSRQGCSG